MNEQKASKHDYSRGYARLLPVFAALALLFLLAACKPNPDDEISEPPTATSDAAPPIKASAGPDADPSASAAAAINLSESTAPRRRDRIKALFQRTLERLHPLRNFSAAKRAAVKIYRDHRSTFYCACGFSSEGAIDTSRCGYVPRVDGRRATKLEWEHVVPAHAFGEHRACWTTELCKDSKARTYKGRRCCQKEDAEFRSMEADLQNLVPEVGELNQRRSNFGFGEVSGEPRLFGRCDFEIDTRAKVVEAEPSLIGDIARIYLYMYHAYPGGLRLEQEELDRFETWHEQDPPTEWERERNRRIVELQGAGNPLLEEGTP